MASLSSQDKRLIEGSPLAFATADSAGKPHVIAVACVKVIGRNKLLITDNYMRQTKKNLAKNKNVCIAVWGKDWKGLKLRGKAEYFASGKWKKAVEKTPENKGLPAKGAIVVKVSKVERMG